MAVAPPATARAAGRRRILMLSPRWPYPVIGGDRLRLWQLARHLARRHDLTLLSLCQTAEEMQAPVPDDGVFAAVQRVHLPRWQSWLQMAAALPTTTPLQVAYYRSAAFRRTVEAHLPAHDLVCCHLVRTAPYAAPARMPRWLEMTDAVSLTMARAAGTTVGPLDPRRWLYRLEARRMQAWERRLAPAFDLVTLVSAVDAEAVDPTGRAPVLVAPNGVDLPAGPLAPAGARPPNIALVGRMDSLANRDALWFFVREVLPGVRRRVPAAELHLIGHVTAADQARLARLPGVRVVGTVARLEQALQRCRVGVCPVRIGAGVQNKVLDYLAHGLACVSSPIGLEGLRLQPGQNAVCATAADEWINEVCGLLRDDERCTSIGSGGVEWIARHGAWARALDPLLERIDALLSTADAAARSGPMR
jgi:glycosyltransferase involved in cell wall biosynthesis